eukprot:PhF_6_TR41479/c0_g1_i1/m.62880
MHAQSDATIALRTYHRCPFVCPEKPRAQHSRNETVLQELRRTLRTRETVVGIFERTISHSVRHPPTAQVANGRPFSLMSHNFSGVNQELHADQVTSWTIKLPPAKCMDHC